ncbi:MAG: hypothetical protein H6Q23_2181, partial [Bacteroidetes bacterium]|nr:hypothetical protein [Bacteroidota bacterium]
MKRGILIFGLILLLAGVASAQ